MTALAQRPQMSSDLEVIAEVGLDRLDDVVALFAHTWWTRDRTREQIATMLRNTPVTVGLYSPDLGRLVAFTRAFSDGVYKALVMDVVVDETMRRNRIGHRLIEELLAHPAISAVEEVELYCNPGRDAFYRDAGFAVPDALQFMRRTRA